MATDATDSTWRKATTYKSRENFVSSLQVTIPLDQVNKEDRKCVICWKKFSEPEEGLDNAEQPIRLPCNHVLGQDCARALFALPSIVEVILRPLSYERGRMGEALGRALLRLEKRLGKGDSVAALQLAFGRFLESLPTSTFAFSPFACEKVDEKS